MNAWLNPGDRLSFSALQERAWRVGRASRCLAVGQAIETRAGHDGWLRVGSAAVWLTLQGQPDDWVLQPGECFVLRRGQRVVVGPWRAGTVAQLHWQAQAAPAAWWGLLAWARQAWGRCAAAWARRAARQNAHHEARDRMAAFPRCS